MIYLDYAATSPIRPEVVQAMLPFLTEHFGNPSSIHRFGQTARKAIDQARQNCLQLLGAFSTKEILFTGSGTESCNMAIFGLAMARQHEARHLIVSAIEHPAVLEPARILRDHFDFEITEIQPDSEGMIPTAAIEAAIRKDTALISIMTVNNEVGSIQNIKKIAKIARQAKVPFHTDACQAPGYTDIRVDHLDVDLLSLNGSKIYGPKGVGLLYVREGTPFFPLIHGGRQEFRMRGGTENTAFIVGFAKALELVLSESKKEAKRIEKLRELLEEGLKKWPGVKINALGAKRTPHILNLQLPGVSGETVVMRLDLEGIAVSSGSACASGKTEPSHVLMAMGRSQKEAKESLRISLGRFTTEAEIQVAYEKMDRLFSDSLLK